MSTETTSTSVGTYRILASRIGELTAAIEKLAKRAARLHLPPITMAVGEPIDVPYVRMGEPGMPETYYVTYSDYAAKSHRVQESLAEMERQGRIRYRRFHDVEIVGEWPRLAGWEFCATLQHLETEDGTHINMLRVAPGVDCDLPEQYRTATAENCDHCKKRIRNRKDTFILRHVADESAESGRWMQVGRSCTQSFLGGRDPHAVAAALDMLLSATSAATEAAGDDDWGGGGGGRLEARWPLREFLSVVAMFVRRDGWVSRGRARQIDEWMPRITATADSAVEYLSPPPRDSKARADWMAWVAAHPVTDADKATAGAALDFARSDLTDRTSRSDYEHNLTVACQLASVDARLAGIVASLVPYHLREIEQLVERQAAKESRYVGDVGQRLLLTVTLAKILVVGEMSQFGPSYLHKMVVSEGDAAGARLVWFASSKGEMAEGQTYHVKATVKAHTVRDGAKQTTVARLSILSEEDAAKERAKAERAAKRVKKAAAAQPEQRA